MIFLIIMFIYLLDLNKINTYHYSVIFSQNDGHFTKMRIFFKINKRADSNTPTPLFFMEKVLVIIFNIVLIIISDLEFVGDMI